MKKILLFVLLILLVGLSFYSPKAEVKKYSEKILVLLDREQILDYLNKKDIEDGLTDTQLGAKYIWGYIPADREIPYKMGLWWSNLSISEKELLKLQWFNEHLDEINVDDVKKYIDIEELARKVQEEEKYEMKNSPIEKITIKDNTPIITNRKIDSNSKVRIYETVNNKKNTSDKKTAVPEEKIKLVDDRKIISSIKKEIEKHDTSLITKEEGKDTQIINKNHKKFPNIYKIPNTLKNSGN